MPAKRPATKKAISPRKQKTVNGSNMEDFLAGLPEDELKIVELLRKIVHSCIPGVEEKISYNVPFYRQHYAICYIWPGSVQWGNVKHSGVQFGFNQGYLMTDETGYLERGNRKQVFWKVFHSIKEIDTDLLKSYLYEAAAVDAELARQKRSKKKG